MEVTVEQKLKALYKLQNIDSEIDEIRSTRGELPIEVADLEDEIEGLQTRLNNLTDESKHLEDEIATLKSKIKDSQQLIKKYEAQLLEVKNNREYDALNKEIELQGLEVQASEKRIREHQIDIEQKVSVIEEAQTEVDGRKQDLENKKAELETIVAETKKDEAQLDKKRSKAAEPIEDRLLNAYNKLRANMKNGVSIAPIVRDSCGGCFAKIPPQRQLDVRQRKKIIVCEHCGRVLVDAQLPEELEAVKA